jgi:RNA polymerase-associated protein CTR9
LVLGIHPSDSPEAKLYEEATTLLNEAERYGQGETGVLLRKGLLLLAQKNLKMAEYPLKTVLSREPDNVAAIVAAGCCSYLGGDWKSALGSFQNVLKKLPSCPETVRLAVGQCMLKLGNEKSAEAAFDRVLAMNPGNVLALVALAVLSLNRGATAKGMQLLKQAYDIDKQNPIVLFHLANHFFFKKDLVKAMSLAQSAQQNSGKSEERQADSLYMIGKINHAQGNFDASFTCFSEAVKLNPNLVLAQLGLGQMYLQRGDFSSATDCFERVVELQKASGKEIKDAEFWTMMGSTCLGDEKRTKTAEVLLKKAAALGARSFDLLIALASLYETRDPAEASKCYKDALSIDSARFNANAELCNNYAVMLHMTGSLEGALTILRIASDLSRAGNLHGICRFNEARILEDMGHFNEAEAIYKELITVDQNDVVVHLRLGIICSRLGQHGEAAEHYKEAIGIEDTNIDAWVLLASNHLRVKALTPARKGFERILKQFDRHDPFSLVALGIIYVEIGRHEAKRDDPLRRALEFFIKALQLDSKNFVAANGVGVVLAELGKFKEAKEIFLQVKQAAPSFMDASLNLAHCFVELGQFGAAIHAYEGLLERLHGPKKAGMLLFLARAYYAQAKADRELVAFEASIKQLETAMALLPEDAPIKFNIALCQQEYVAAMAKKGITEDDSERAISMIGKANTAFQELSELTENKSLDQSMIAQRLKYCSSLAHSIETKVDTLRHTLHDRQAKLHAVQQQRAEQQASEAARRQADEESRLREQERNEEIRKELAAKFRSTEERVRAAGSDEEDGGEMKRKRSGEGNDREERRKKSEVKRPKKRETKREKKSTTDEENSGEDEIMVVRKSLRRTALSKDLISDSEHSDDK